MSEIKHPLIVEAEHWNKLLEFAKDQAWLSKTDDELENILYSDSYQSASIAKSARSVLKEIGELND